MVQHGNRFARGEKEPTASEADHRVPHEPDRGRRDVELNETLPSRKAIQRGRFLQFVRNRLQRLVERKRHVPCLAREYREYGRELEAEETAVKQRDEGRDDDGEIAEHRYGLQDVEQWDEDSLGAFTARREVAVDEREERRPHQRYEHAQRRSCGVVGKIPRIEIDVRYDFCRKRYERARAYFRDNCEQRQYPERDGYVGQTERQGTRG